MKHILLVGISLILFVSNGYAQKVKYKNLFVLLKAENYKDGGPFLRKFLAVNPEHPDANYQMGKMLASSMLEQDIFEKSDRIMELADSSISYFNKATQLCTVKYVEKQHDDDYYAEFKRRDLRTGKFTVKTGDVQLDIENRIKAVEKYKENNLALIHHFQLAEKFYNNLTSLYSTLTTKAKTLNLLYFTADANDLQTLRDIGTIYDSCLYNYNTFRVIVKDLNKKVTPRNLIVKPMASYPIEVNDSLDFATTNVEMWDYKSWAKTTLDKITREVFPLKERMVEYDEELVVTHNRIVEDSLDGRSEVFGLATRNVGKDINDYVKPSLPAAIFNYRIAEMNYHSTVNFWYKEVSDTSNVEVKLNVLSDIEKQLSSLSSLIVRLKDVDTKESEIMFMDFLNARYGDEPGFEAFVQEQVNFVHDDSVQLQQWIVDIKEQDSKVLWHGNLISLVVGNTMFNVDSTLFSTILVDSVEHRKMAFYSWFENKDTLSFTFGLSPSSRILDTLFSLPISPKLKKIGKENLNVLSDSLGVSERVWVVSSTIEEKGMYDVYLFTSHIENGLKWDEEIALSQQPKAVQIDPKNGQIALLNDSDEIIIVLDKDGSRVEKNN